MEILTELTNNILLITLNRPEAGNSLNGALSEGLSNALTDAETNPEVRAIVITGAGEKIFCAGMDLSVGGNVFGLDETMHPTLEDMQTKSSCAWFDRLQKRKGCEVSRRDLLCLRA
jgi:enoyl-CoA hydratase/carnithine racemase